jgi:hypothetical protein
MPPPFEEGACNQARLRAILLEQLQAAAALSWPGSDGLTVEDALAAYLAAASERRVPGQEELCRRYPALAADITAFFAYARHSVEPMPSSNRTESPS